NRIQSFDRVRATVDALLAAGIRGVNFDLMYGLPYQTTSMLLRTVEASLALFPDRIALFGYAHVPWMARNQRLLPGEALPGAAERFEQAEAAGALLEERGYVRIGLDHFARPEDPMAQAAADGTLKRSFQGYTVDAAEGLIGLGTTAISTLPQGYAQNLPETRGWSRALAEGRLPVHRGIALSAEDRLRHAVIERLMCDLGVDAAAVARAHGFRSHHFAAVYGRLQELVEAGLVHLEGTRITVPEAARPALRIVASVFDAYLAPEQPGRHSVAI
ncbi:MAG TPA: coproporphyrinogen III oxidase, partial [Paracoccaceae bacterium]|nr:coproporphyrinogen III oxidase [Paracoccaceae bacterium]